MDNQKKLLNIGPEGLGGNLLGVISGKYATYPIDPFFHLKILGTHAQLNYVTPNPNRCYNSLPNARDLFHNAIGYLISQVPSFDNTSRDVVYIGKLLRNFIGGRPCWNVLVDESKSDNLTSTDITLAEPVKGTRENAVHMKEVVYSSVEELVKDDSQLKKLWMLGIPPSTFPFGWWEDKIKRGHGIAVYCNLIEDRLGYFEQDQWPEGWDYGDLQAFLDAGMNFDDFISFLDGNDFFYFRNTLFNQLVLNGVASLRDKCHKKTLATSLIDELISFLEE